ncbi:short-chain dehydrogenase [Micractinium conductrix]|uniref:Short-chain dehydrogenase n=1 Tax=Micractinium conductrix TaxID=554055 RepID=A0A2P6VNQ5_9CHLO|nr:short-chain dehydrogenase [Micractinium conductrix]|eukprot:PSC75726.1 short-chain dehydrogenase [Micractinium conductrix]
MTGGSRGFSFALAQEFLRMGDSVALCGRDAGRLEAAVATLRAECGDASRVHGLPANCISPQVQSLCRLGGVDLWINNAGEVTAKRLLVDVPPEEVVQVVGTNVLGSLLGSQAALRLMLRQPLTKSAVTHKATKRALTQLCESLAQELAEAGVTSVGVHNVSPGMLLTDLLLHDSTLAARRVFNALAEEPEVVAAALAPRIRAVGGSGTSIDYLAPADAAARMLRTLPEVAGLRDGRFFDSAAPHCLLLPPHHLQPASSDPSKPPRHPSPRTMALFLAAAKAVALARGNPACDAYKCKVSLVDADKYRAQLAAKTSTLAYSRSCSARIGAVHEVAPLSSAADWPRLAEQEAPCTPTAPVWAARVTPSTASAAAPTTATPTPTVPTRPLLILKEAEDVLPRTPARPAPYLLPARRADASAATLAGGALVLPTFAAPAPTPSPCYTPPAKRTAAQHAAAAAAPRPGRTCPFPSLTAGPLLPRRAFKRHDCNAAQWRRRAEPETASSSSSSSSSAAAAADAEAEETFYEGSGSNAELALSLALGATLICLPLTIASIGRRLWVSYKFTNKRLIVRTDSPVLKREVQVEYTKIKEIRSAPRAFGLWGDVVFFLKDGSRLPLAGLERYQDIVDYVQGKIQ